MQVTNSISETIRLSAGSTSEENILWTEEFKKRIENLPNAEDFRDAYFICVENNTDGEYLQNCYGVTLALRELRNNPKAKVILYGVLPMQYIRKRKPEINLVLKYENARIMESPFRIEDLAVVFQKPKEILTESYTVAEETKKYISTILHGLHYVPNWDQPTAEQHPGFKNAMERVYEYFPSFVGKPIPEIIEFLKSASDSRKEVMKGVKLSGVYCDVEGTILVDGQLNQKVVAKLQEFEQQGKTVCLWTDGDVEHLKKDLESLGISYQVLSKFDHAGAVAEVIIDDQDEYTFSARTKISAEKFIRVSDLT